MTPPKVLVIERKKWRRGAGEDNGCEKRGLGKGPVTLLNDKGYMCCLGFDARAWGFTPKQIRGLGRPDDIPVDETPEDYAKTHTRTIWLVDKAIEINDDSTLTEEQREEKLIPILKKLSGYTKVIFK